VPLLFSRAQSLPPVGISFPSPLFFGLYLFSSFLTVGERLSAETLASQGLSFENLKKIVPQNNFFK
jgi:hypothetical protein